MCVVLADDKIIQKGKWFVIKDIQAFLGIRNLKGIQSDGKPK
jgi:hypothetical protein